MNPIVIIIGFLFGFTYNGIATHVTDKLTNTKYHFMLGITALFTAIAGLIVYIWTTSFTIGLLAGTGTVFAGLVAFYIVCAFIKSDP